MEFIEITLDNIIEATDAQMKIFEPKECAYLCYLQHIQNNDPPYYLVKDNGNIVGITGIYIEPFEPETAWLGWYGVIKEYRKMGYGTKILNHTINIAKQNGFKHFRLYTDIDNKTAHILYNQIMDFSEEYVEPDFKVLIYSKSLCNSPCPKLNNKFINLASKDKEQDDGYNLYKIEKAKQFKGRN